MSDLIKPTPGGMENKIDLKEFARRGKEFLAQEGVTPAPAPVAPAPPAIAPAPTSASPQATPVPNTPVLQSRIAVVEQPAPTATVTPQETPVVEAPAAPAPAAVPSPAEAQDWMAAIADDAFYRIKEDGVEKVVQGKDLKTGVMLHRKFTTETQKFRAEEKDLRARAEMAERLQRLVTNPDAYVRYGIANPVMAQAIARHFGTTPQAIAQGQFAGQPPAAPAAPFAAPAPAAPAPAFTPSNPNEVVSMGDLAAHLGSTAASIQATTLAALQEKAQGIVGNVKEEIAKEVRALDDARQVSAYNAKIDEVIGGIVQQAPMLAVIPNINGVLREEVMKLQPTSVQEMFESFGTVAQGILQDLRQQFLAERAPAVVAKQEMVANNIPPQVGTAPNTTIVPDKLDFRGRDGKVDLRKIRTLGRAFVAAH